MYNNMKWSLESLCKICSEKKLKQLRKFLGKQ